MGNNNQSVRKKRELVADRDTPAENRNDRIDRIYRYAMLTMGLLAAALFLFSLVAMIEFPGAFKYLAIAMVLTAAGFLVLRTIYHFRDTFRVKQKNKATRK